MIKIQNAKIKMTNQNSKLLNSFCILQFHFASWYLIFELN